MMTKDLAVLLALKALVQAALPGVDVKGFDKDAEKPARVGPHGCIIGDPGEPGEPEVDLSPLAYNYSHAVELTVTGPSGKGGADLDPLLLAIGDAIDADPTLNGLCSFLSCETADLNDQATDTGAAINWATLTIVAEYRTENPLG